ncbi:MAG: four helix bundle protein [Phycisphaeraceae bacterium]|nr:four helix bundle protein [Phycisphaeraceae bacterium]
MDNERAKASRFTDLIVWQKAHEFVLSVYRLTGQFPKHELYGLTSQFRRAAVSVPANIAEGFQTHHPAEKSRYLGIARGSLDECQYYLILAKDLGYGHEDSLQSLCIEIGKLLRSYQSKVKQSIS